jgi:hypothetical protein
MIDSSPKKLPIGVSAGGLLHKPDDVVDIETRFAMARDAGIFDYIESSPPPGMIDQYASLAARYDMPVRAGLFYYVLGRDEPLIEWHFRAAAALGSTVHTMQIMANDANGAAVSDDDVAQAYLRAFEIGERLGVTPSLEVHVNMWSENFARVARVAAMVAARGVKFNLTLDHSHVIFKIDNPEELKVQGLADEIAGGAVTLDPFAEDGICGRWIDANLVTHVHARSTVPATAVTRTPEYRAVHGRGIQYPFIQPPEGSWTGEWDAEALRPWQHVVRQMLQHHATHADSCLGQISTEFIPFPDYGGGSSYSIIDNNIACARWIRDLWQQIQTDAG